MKKTLLLPLLLFTMDINLAFAADIDSQIDQLQSEISAKYDEIHQLRQTENDADTITFEDSGLKYEIQLSSEPVDDEYYLTLNLTIINTTDEPLKFQSDWFRTMLADVSQTVVLSMDTLDVEAIPENATLQGYNSFKMTKDVLNSKGLTIRYKKDDTIFEFLVNDYKFIQ